MVLKPEQSKVKVISELDTLDKTRSKLKSILDIVNYFAKFAPNFADVTVPLRCLLKKDTEFVWDEHDNAFKKTKNMISNVPILGYYNPKTQLSLQCDCS